MSKKFRDYLIDSYIHHGDYIPKKLRKDFALQIDDQDDNDNIEEFCNVFVTVGDNNNFTIELIGKIPITKRIADLAEIYEGYANQQEGRILLRLNPHKIEALTELAARILETALIGEQIDNRNWFKISARTISTLYRFVRVVKEYQTLKSAGL